MKPRIRVKAPSRMVGLHVPDDAQPGDLIVGNRGAAARCREIITSGPSRLRSLVSDYVGNYNDGVRPDAGCRMYDFR